MVPQTSAETRRELCPTRSDGSDKKSCHSDPMLSNVNHTEQNGHTHTHEHTPTLTHTSPRTIQPTTGRLWLRTGGRTGPTGFQRVCITNNRAGAAPLHRPLRPDGRSSRRAGVGECQRVSFRTCARDVPTREPGLHLAWCLNPFTVKPVGHYPREPFHPASREAGSK